MRCRERVGSLQLSFVRLIHQPGRSRQLAGCNWLVEVAFALLPTVTADCYCQLTTDY
jgi:hypothetical protein